MAKQFPSAQIPPATDVGGLPMDWASFNNAPRRIQNGGWARQVTVEDFAISKEISGVNMRLTAGGIRELHWHQAAEWAIMTYGNCRVTVLDAQGRPYVARRQRRRPLVFSRRARRIRCRARARTAANS